MQDHKRVADRITIEVPLKFVARGGRKTVFAPVIDRTPPNRRFDSTLIKALARSHRWRKLIEDGEYISISELADARGINQSYACRILRLLLVSPTIVADILNGRQAPALTLSQLLKGFSLEWAKQHDLAESQKTRGSPLESRGHW